MITTKRFELQQGDIDKGMPGRPAYCPVALALRRQLPTGWEVSVRVGIGLKHRDDGTYIWFPIPDSVRRFVGAFDDEQPVEPFEFELPDLGRMI